MAIYLMGKLVVSNVAPRAAPRAAPTCERCGMRDLKWRWMDCGWRLYENERVEYNRLKEHNCSLAKASDFDAFD